MRKALIVLAALLLVPTVLLSQDTLSQQVLQLLTRTNSWTGTQTFYDLRIPVGAVPSVTTQRVYADPDGDLYYGTTLLAGADGATAAHNLLSSTHADTSAVAVTRASVIVGNSTPAWAKVTPTVTGSVLRFDGTDTTFSTDGSALTSLTAANLTGALPAISGASLTALNASNLSTGTVPLARLVGITDAQIDAAAAIAYSKLDLAASVDLAADITGTLPYTNGGTGVTTAGDDGVLIGSGVAWAEKTLPSCTGGTGALQYNATTNAFSCGTISVGTGTVTSVALALPAIFSVSGSPVTGTGTLTGALATQTANRIWAGPTTGAAASPTFRALVNADLPTTGVAGGTYAKVTVNTAGVVTAAATDIDLTADVAATVLPMANGGTGNSTSADDRVLVGNGATWVQQTLPDCDKLLQYDQTTNAFSCGQTVALGTITASTPLSVTATWNDAGVTFNQLLVNVTNTASASGSSFLDLQLAGVRQYAVLSTGVVYQAGVVFASLGTPSNGSWTYCPDCTKATPCAGGGTGAFAKRVNGAWDCD
jgi:hypothetical protein